MSFNLIPLLTSIKKWFNLDCDTAVNGKQAVDMYTERLNLPCKCKDRTYKLIIMDLNMPIMNGEQATKRILDLQRQRAINLEDIAYTSVVFHTAYSNERVREMAEQIGARWVIAKPAQQEELTLIFN